MANITQSLIQLSSVYVSQPGENHRPFLSGPPHHSPSVVWLLRTTAMECLVLLDANRTTTTNIKQTGLTPTRLDPIRSNDHNLPDTSQTNKNKTGREDSECTTTSHLCVIAQSTQRRATQHRAGVRKISLGVDRSGLEQTNQVKFQLRWTRPDRTGRPTQTQLRRNVFHHTRWNS